MCHFTVNSCCCLSLSTAGYILGFVDLFFHVVRFVYFQEFQFHTDYRLIIERKLIFLSFCFQVVGKKTNINSIVCECFVLSNFLSFSCFFFFPRPRSNLIINLHQLDLWDLLGKCTLMCCSLRKKGRLFDVLMMR